MNEDLEVIVIAGGEGSRFKSDTPKHLVKIAGDYLILGTANKLKKYVDNLKIIIPPKNEIYKQIINDSFQIVDRRGDVTKGTSKHLEAINNSSDNNNLLIIYGDTYFSQKGLARIFQNASMTSEKITFFCRYNSVSFVNKGGGEIFAVYLNKQYKNHFIEAAKKTQELFESKKIWRDSTWEIAKTLKDLSTENEFREHLKYDFYYEINDSTDDIDFIEEYHHLKRLFLDSLEEATLLLEVIYESFNNIAQKVNINIANYESKFQNNAFNLKIKKFNLGEIIEEEFDKVINEVFTLRKQLSDVYSSRSMKFTAIFRKIKLLFNQIS
jgi:GTP:adenosylcobinamide-phosphate guanylyltransferase